MRAMSLLTSVVLSLGLVGCTSGGSSSGVAGPAPSANAQKAKDLKKTAQSVKHSDAECPSESINGNWSREVTEGSEIVKESMEVHLERNDEGVLTFHQGEESQLVAVNGQARDVSFEGQTGTTLAYCQAGVLNIGVNIDAQNYAWLTYSLNDDGTVLTSTIDGVEEGKPFSEPGDYTREEN